MDPFELIQIIDELKTVHLESDMQDRLNAWKRKIVLHPDFAGASYYIEFISDLEKEKTIIEAILRKIKTRKK